MTRWPGRGTEGELGGSAGTYLEGTWCGTEGAGQIWRTHHTSLVLSQGWALRKRESRVTGVGHGAIHEVSSCGEPQFGGMARSNEFS